MEGQGFNPNPAPTSGQTPIPEPVPQDSFAQPSANTGMGWQPNQATMPAVGGMNTPYAAPAPELKKNNAVMAVVIVLALVVVIAGAVIATAFLSSNGDLSDMGLSTQAKQRNLQREDDIARFIIATNDYQTNNSGNTPFGDGSKYDKEKLGQFVSRYIDNGINKSGEAKGQPFVCAARSCPQFTDPDGTVYGFTVDATGGKNGKIKYDSKEIDHIIHVYVGAACDGDDDGTYVGITSVRAIAMFYRLEGGKTTCNDNGGRHLNEGPQQGSGNTDGNSADRNAQRAYDIARFITAAVDYQTNNYGKTPFGTSNNLSTDFSGFVQRYIEPNVKTANQSRTTCESGQKCDEFKDPDGALYILKAMTKSSADSTLSGLSGISGVNHVLYVAMNAQCSKEGINSKVTLEDGSGDRNYAIFYKAEDGKMICFDNR